jgi:uncharacterized membrane protein
MAKFIYPWLAFSLMVLGSCATQRVVGYQNDISPILHNKCQQCHLPPSGEGYIKTGLNMATYETLMNGTVFGKVIIPGDSKRSVINKLAEGRAGELMRMPHGDAKKMTEAEIELLRLWVDQGALKN